MTERQLELVNLVWDNIHQLIENWFLQQPKQCRRYAMGRHIKPPRLCEVTTSVRRSDWLEFVNTVPGGYCDYLQFIRSGIQARLRKRAEERRLKYAKS